MPLKLPEFSAAAVACTKPVLMCAPAAPCFPAAGLLPKPRKQLCPGAVLGKTPMGTFHPGELGISGKLQHPVHWTENGRAHPSQIPRRSQSPIAPGGHQPNSSLAGPFFPLVFSVCPALCFLGLLSSKLSATKLVSQALLSE